MSSTPSRFRYHLTFTVRPATGPERNRPSIAVADADSSRSISKMRAAIHSPRWPDVIGRCMIAARSASIALRLCSSAATCSSGSPMAEVSHCPRYERTYYAGQRARRPADYGHSDRHTGVRPDLATPFTRSGLQADSDKDRDGDGHESIAVDHDLGPDRRAVDGLVWPGTRTSASPC